MTTAAPTSPAHQAAIEAYAAGLSVLPPREDGSKTPDANAWADYQETRADLAAINAWYANGRTGIGAVMGKVSGNIELFEFDDLATYEAFLEAADQAGLGELVGRIRAGYEERTPGDGVHWLTRCTTI